MKLTRAQKVYVLVLVLAALALVIDRVFLPPPQDASAAHGLPGGGPGAVGRLGPARDLSTA